MDRKAYMPPPTPPTVAVEMDKRLRRASREWLKTPAGSARASPDAQQHRLLRTDRTRVWNIHQDGEAADFASVLTLSCMTCGCTLSHRGLRVKLLKDETVLFSSDQRPTNIVELSVPLVPGPCTCRIQDIACICGPKVGYCIVQPCETCMKTQDEHSHQWHFYSHCVAEEMRTADQGGFFHWPLPAQEDEPTCRLLQPPTVPLLGLTEDICGPSPSLVAESNGRSSAASRKPQDSVFLEQLPLRDSNGRCSNVSIKQRHSAENLRPHARNQSPLQDSSGRCIGTGAKPQKNPRRNDELQAPSVGRLEADLRHRETVVAEREDQMTWREAELFEKELEQSAHAKLLRSVSAANQEKEAELRDRQERIEQAELQARTAEQDLESNWDTVREAHSVAGQMMAEAKQAELRVQQQILEEKENSRLMCSRQSWHGSHCMHKWKRCGQL